jgi:ABC-type proline/glycine betaine transport system permease subunit
MNNTSIFTADRSTHLKIVVISLICATLVAGIGIAARVSDSTTVNSRFETSVMRAGAPVTASSGHIAIR